MEILPKVDTYIEIRVCSIWCFQDGPRSSPHSSFYCRMVVWILHSSVMRGGLHPSSVILGHPRDWLAETIQ